MIYIDIHDVIYLLLNIASSLYDVLVLKTAFQKTNQTFPLVPILILPQLVIIYTLLMIIFQESQF